MPQPPTTAVNYRRAADRGCSLIELLVVVIVLGALAAIAIPTLLVQRAKARDSATKADVSTMGKVIAAYFVDGEGPLTCEHSTPGRVDITDGSINAVARLTVGSTRPSARAFRNLDDPDDWCAALTDRRAASGTSATRPPPASSQAPAPDGDPWLKTPPPRVETSGDRGVPPHTPEHGVRMLPRLRSRLRPLQGEESGFTLVEMVVVMSILGIVMSIGVFGFTNWRNTVQQQGTADELVSALRNASTRAISEGRTYCVQIAADGRSHTQWRVTCNTGTQVSGAVPTQGNGVTLAATVPFPSTVPTPSPAPACATGAKCLYFYPRGTAIPAQVVVESAARNKTYTVRVEGLTARVYQ